MDTLIAEFLHHLRFSRRLSEHTVEAYRADLEHFSTWAQTQIKTPDFLLELDHYHVRDYLAFCFYRYQNVSIARHLSALRGFFRFLVKRGVIKASPVDLIENPQFKKPLPKPVTVEEAFLLCEEVEPVDIIALRDRVICELLYASGLRISELVNLNVDDVDLASRLIRVMGKGKKERIVPIHEACKQRLILWLSLHRGLLLKDGAHEQQPALFIGSRGERIHARVVRYALAQLGKNLNINRPLHPHRFRHAYATHMLESGADLRSIQELLGHNTIAATERYTEVDLSSLMKQYDHAHPHAKKPTKR